MIEVACRYQDGEEFIYMDHRNWLLNDPGALAELLASEEMKESGSDLDDPAEWPRRYEMLINGEWITASVEMEYEPTFHSTVNRKG